MKFTIIYTCYIMIRGTDSYSTSITYKVKSHIFKRYSIKMSIKIIVTFFIAIKKNSILKICKRCILIKSKICKFHIIHPLVLKSWTLQALFLEMYLFSYWHNLYYLIHEQ